MSRPEIGFLLSCGVATFGAMCPPWSVVSALNAALAVLTGLLFIECLFSRNPKKDVSREP